VQADITSKHRQMTQETLYRLKKLELGQKDLATDSAEPVLSGSTQLSKPKDSAD